MDTLLRNHSSYPPLLLRTVVKIENDGAEGGTGVDSEKIKTTKTEE